MPNVIKLKVKSANKTFYVPSQIRVLFLDQSFFWYLQFVTIHENVTFSFILEIGIPFVIFSFILETLCI